MFDLASDPTSQAIAAEFFEAGKVVSAVCHGPAALVDVRIPGGKFLLEGKEVTGYVKYRTNRAPFPLTRGPGFSSGSSGPLGLFPKLC